jgi:hypothetical protein
MGHVILLSELERARPARLRGPLPEGGATISLFLGVRYQRRAMEHEAAIVADGSYAEMAPLDDPTAPKPDSSGGRRGG